MRTRALIAHAVVAAAAVSAGPATAAAPLDAEFTVSPDAPRAGETVRFESTTTTTGTAPVRLAWDLDGDGAFDDGTARTVTRTFDAGAHVVKLKATQTGAAVIEDVETKTVEVRPKAIEIGGDPGADQHGNDAPVARFDDLCIVLKSGGPRSCTAGLAKVDKPKTFAATTSSDVDGHVVRYQWDLDGDGTFEQDTGGEPRVTTTYRSADPRTVRVRVTDDRGATGVAALQLRLLDADCIESMTFKRVHATSPCFRRTVSDTGVTRYESTFPVDVNGIVIAPREDRSVVLRTWTEKVPIRGLGGAGAPRHLSIVSFGAQSAVDVRGHSVLLADGSLSWEYRDHRLFGIRPPAGGDLHGLRFSGVQDGIELPLAGTAKFAIYPKLPTEFGAPSADVPLTQVVSNVSLPNVRARAASMGPLEFHVPDAAIGSVGLRDVWVKFDGEDLWEVHGIVGLPAPLSSEFEGGAGIRAGKFNYAKAAMDWPSPGLSIGPVFMTHIGFEIQINPKKGNCIRNIGTENGRDYGIPSFALCGEIALSAGPQVLDDKRALGIDGELGFATYDGDRPAVVRAYGDAKVVDIPLATAEIEVHTNGYVNASGSWSWGLPNLVNLTGGLGLELKGTRFNATGHIEACLQFVYWCQGGRGLVSNKGIAGCLDVDLYWDTWHPGFGYRWNGDFTPYFSGCDLGPYRETVARARAAQAGGAGQSIRVPAGLPGIAFAAEGADGAPVITLFGPNGERYSSPRERRVVAEQRFLAIPNERAKLTQIAVPKPAAGTWRVVTEEGSTPVTSLKTAEGLPEPKVKARVVERGGRHLLRYEIAERPGQTVTFSERGASAGEMLGTARGARGELAFHPADGVAERRRIVAVVSQDGLPRTEIDVATYSAPAAAKAGAVRGLKVVRRGSTLRVGWKKAARAERHRVTVALGDGRRTVALTRGTSRVIRRVPASTRATVAVAGVTRSGVIGRAARVNVRAARR